MPKTDIHIEASVRKTGKGHPEIHGFVDFEIKKPERHDITRMVDHSRLLEKNMARRLCRNSSSTFTMMSSANSGISYKP